MIDISNLFLVLFAADIYVLLIISLLMFANIDVKRMFSVLPIFAVINLFLVWLIIIIDICNN